VKQADVKSEYIVLKAMVFPFINVLWLGTVVMVIGFLLSLWNRVRQKKLPAILDAGAPES
jgi:cytochrome c-type biogenesis protein CcmF